ncbi:hypothetical protein EW145_g2151 [Phellinidium pouzarii]|uniref:AAA-ATPase-like domain-containing protein n=1 Tax=Phellinidium pouzarii TaxID=167371 RepID=A0A4S4LHF5_9AGAM|nr:hypothetical protein EW145_g2151 [Phellinidium pouzarii]
MLSMFQAFFEAGDSGELEERRTLFERLRLKIYDTRSFELHFAQYDVVYIDFSNLRGVKDKKEFDTMFGCQLSDEVIRHEDLGHFKDVTELTDLEMIEIMSTPNDSTKIVLEKAFFELSRILHNATGRKILVLVDEYDTPVSSAANEGTYIYVQKFLRRVFSTLLRKTPYIFGALLVGILRCEKSGFLSNVPSVKFYPLAYEADLYGDSCFFTEEEVRTLYDHDKALHPHLGFSYDTMKQLYGSYVGAKQELYSPWAVCRAFESQSLRMYWNESGPGYFLSKHIFGLGDHLLDLYASLLGGSSISPTIHGRLYHISYGNLTPNDIIGLFYYAGYLTEVKPNTFEILNNEVRGAYVAWLRYHIVSSPTFRKLRDSASAVVEVAISGTIAKFRSLFRKCFEQDYFSLIKRKGRNMNKIFVLGILMDARNPLIDFTVLRHSYLGVVAFGLHDSRTNSAAIVVLSSRALHLRSSPQRAASSLLSRINFNSLSSQLPQRITFSSQNMYRIMWYCVRYIRLIE